MQPRTPPEAASEALAALLAARQTVRPRRLGAPGPDAAQLRALLEAARHAPDHGGLVPWRFILVPAAARPALAEAFAQALRERDPLAGADDLARAREKAARAPVLLLVAVDEGTHAADGGHIPAAERVFSAGCAVQNVLLMATALGYGTALTSGRSLQSRALRTLFGLRDGERALCFASIGTVLEPRPRRERPAPAHYTCTLVPGQGTQPWEPLSPSDASEPVP